MTSRVFVAGFSCLLGLVLAAGCGSGRPPPEGSASGTGPGGSGGGGGLFAPDAGPGDAPPGCGQQNDGTYCDCVDAPLFADPPNMYFVLDRSGSMRESSKWTTVRVVMAKILRSLGPRANFGATMFPGNDEQCAPGPEIMSTRPGDPPSSTKDGPTTQFLINATLVSPFGGTSTSATLRDVLPRVKALPGKTFVILATDGGPNCNASLSCTFETCMPNIEDSPGCPVLGPENCCAGPNTTTNNCLDAVNTIGAVRAIAQAGIPVYVIGLPGTEAYGDVMDQMAIAGGTGQTGAPTKYYPVSTANEASLLAALKKVAAKITATCTFELTELPADPALVNVYLDEVVLPYDPARTWKIDGKTVTLLGDSCKKVLAGDVLDVRIIAGCPRIAPR